MPIDGARQAQLIEAINDHASRYAGPHCAIRGMGPSDAARYVAEAHVPGGATREERDWIADYIREHPEVLDRPPLTLAQLAQRDRERAAEATGRAVALSREARRAFDRGDQAEALRLVGQGEALDPYARNWAGIRARIAAG